MIYNIIIDREIIIDIIYTSEYIFQKNTRYGYCESIMDRKNSISKLFLDV